MIGVETLALFFALLAVVANVAVLAIVGLAGTKGLDRVRVAFGEAALPAAFAVAALAVVGSLYFSEIARFEPCRLCWYQRIAMYPLVVILGIAARRGDGGVRHYVLPLATVGAIIATYHYALEWLPWLDSGVCSASTPCTLVWFREFGFISLPYLALSAFLLILALVWVAPRSERDIEVSDLPALPDGSPP